MDPNKDNQPNNDSAQPNSAPALGEETPKTAANEPTIANMEQQSGSPQAAPSAPKKNIFKKLAGGGMAAVIAAVLVVGGASGYYFGVYLPNQPDQIWKKALSNSADGFDRLVELSQEQQDEYSGGTLEGSMKIAGGGMAGDGTINAKYDANSAEGKLDIGVAGESFGLEFRGQIEEGNETPDVFIKASGLNGLAALAESSGGAGQFGPVLQQLENQWVVIDHTLFDSALSAGGGSQSKVADIKPEDVTEIAQKVSEITSEYVFATGDNAVLDLKEQVGEEEFDGRNTYHFRVALNQDNMVKYVTALKDGLKETQLDELIGESYDQGFDDAIENIKEEDISEDDTADVWVDLETKTIRNIRFHHQEDDNVYTDLALLYEGGSEYPFRISVGGDEQYDKFELTMTINTDDSSVSFGADVSGQGMNVEFDAKLTPSNEEFDIEEPSGAKSIYEIIGAFNSAPSTSSSFQSSGGNFQQLNNDLF